MSASVDRKRGCEWPKSNQLCASARTVLRARSLSKQVAIAAAGHLSSAPDEPLDL